jgi:hypothetical protein
MGVRSHVIAPRSFLGMPCVWVGASSLHAFRYSGIDFVLAGGDLLALLLLLFSKNTLVTLRISSFALVIDSW